MTALLSQLHTYRGSNVFNPYAQQDGRFDSPHAAATRLNNLMSYLHDHQHASIALIGEAAGYNGCRFTGIPFTCEAQLAEWHDARYRISSLRSDHDERSARCVWQTLTQCLGGEASADHMKDRLKPPLRKDSVILWNIFPWHPHQPGQPMSNRKPNAAEVRAGCEVLRLFLDWLRPERVVAVGRVAERALREMNVPVTYARHPSHGGNSAFKSAIQSIAWTSHKQLTH